MPPPDMPPPCWPWPGLAPPMMRWRPEGGKCTHRRAWGKEYSPICPPEPPIWRSCGAAPEEGGRARDDAAAAAAADALEGGGAPPVPVSPSRPPTLISSSHSLLSLPARSSQSQR